jgi:hypothetical protein
MSFPSPLEYVLYTKINVWDVSDPMQKRKHTFRDRRVSIQQGGKWHRLGHFEKNRFFDVYSSGLPKITRKS